ncbi:MAG: ComEC/Rec2 family competence protein [Alphaproteobacteria bacterium]
MIQPPVYQSMRQLPKWHAACRSAFWSHMASLTRWLRDCSAADRENRSLALPVLLGVGIGGYFYLATEPPLIPAAGCAALAIVLWRVARAARWQAEVLFWVTACVASGFALASMRTAVADSPQVTRLQANVDLVGRVITMEAGRRGGQRLLLEAASPDGRGTFRLRLSTPRLQHAIRVGDWVRTRADLKPLPGPVIPGGFDFGRKLWFEGVRGLAFTLQDLERIEPPRPPSRVEHIADVLRMARDRITGRILAATSERAGPIAAAFLTGERSGIAEEDNEAMQASSLSHLLSISGLHMMLAGFGVFAAIRYAACLWPVTAHAPDLKKHAAAAALLASFAYLLLSGASIPTQRAFITVAVAFLAVMVDRNAISLRTVALGATAILVLAPEAWVDPSFQMSFCAVMMLVAAYEWWSRMRLNYWREDTWLRRAGAAVLGTAATSVVAGLATAPFAAFHFNRLSLFGVVANVLVMPLVSLVIMPSGVLALLLMPLGLEGLPLWAMDAGLIAMLDVAHWVASWPLASIGVPSFPIEALLAMSLGLCWLAGSRASWRWLGLVPVLAGLAAGAISPRPDILVAASAGNMAVRDASESLSFASARKARFDAEMWLRADGDTRDLSSALASRNSAFACGNGLCLARLGDAGPWVALAAPDATRVACRKASLVVVTGEAADRCNSSVTQIDQTTLSRAGAIAIHLNGNAMKITSASDVRGKRPWVPEAR